MSSDTSLERPANRRLWPWILLGLALVVLAGSQFYRMLLNRQVQRELDALHQQGYPISLSQLQQWHPVVPDEDNAAMKILEAIDDLALDPNAFGRSKWPARTEELGPDERDEFQEILTNNATALETVHAAARLKSSRFPVDYSRGPATLLPHLAKVKSLEQLLRVEGIMASEEGRTDAAVQSVVDGVALARSLDSEPLLISQLVRIACQSISCSTLERLLTQHELSGAQLERLALAFRDARKASRDAFSGGYVGELCMGNYCFSMNPVEYERAMDPQSELTGVIQVLYPLYAWSGLRDRDRLFYIRMMRQTLEASKLPYPAGLAASKEVGQKVERGVAGSRLLILSKMLLPSLGRSSEKAAEADARLRCAEGAIAVERFRIQHNGALPKQLSELPADAISDIATDPFDGSPLRFEPLEPGYVVYSIGPNGVDDGGLPRETENGRSQRGNGYDVTFMVER